MYDVTVFFKDHKHLCFSNVKNILDYGLTTVLVFSDISRVTFDWVDHRINSIMVKVIENE